MPLRLLLAPLLALLAVVPARGAADEPAPDYLRDIRPILEQHCYDCHSSDLAESELRLDAAALAALGGNRGPAVVPGKPDESLLYHTLRGEAGDVPQMPMDGEPLPEPQIELIRRWIEQGAPAPDAEPIAPRSVESDHWSFQPVRRPDVPAVARPDWQENPIDAFILARLAEEGLDPSPAADRATLLRRLSLDLIGLLPTVQELDEFLADPRDDAYERQVERLLSSPHYGERWGRHWLDAARYADSNGFTIDGARSIWKYRDWVIGALNRDLPFDQFTVEQLAGDLLPDATPEQLIATGFHRNTLINQEGGTDQEQFRVEAIVDRVDTTGVVFLGLTLGCAECHNHKFDPISQREFYELFAIFNNADEPTLPIPTPAQDRELKALKSALADASRALKRRDAQLEPGYDDWERQASAPADPWVVMSPLEVASDNGTKLAVLGDGSLLAGDVPANDAYHVTFDVPLDRLTGLRLEVLPHESLPRQGPGTASNGNFILTGFSAVATPAGDDDAAGQLRFDSAAADWSQDKFPIAGVLDDDPATGWAINVSKGGSANVRREAVFVASEAVEHPQGTRLTVTLRHEHPQSLRYLIGRFRVSATDAPRALLAPLLIDPALLAVAPEDRTPEQRAELKRAYLGSDPLRARLSAHVDQLKAREKTFSADVVTTLVMKERAEPRETQIHIRGDFVRRGAAVSPAVPAVLHDLPPEVARPNRLDFARWLVDPENPLTARVTVNRVWQAYFGLGLVETENDFGTQGSPPSHPELLDWLASEFAQGWSLKALHRQIVTSQTYRQSSRLRPELLAADPQNVLLARQSRLRLDAEIIRDAALSASGRLTPTIGGPSVYPPQPEGIYVLTQQVKAWPENQDADRYRRAMYTYFWRSSPYPFLMAFDAPDGNNACTRRPRSNTPLQALTLANDRAFVELAQGLASRILTDAPADDEGRLRYAYRRALAREPQPEELERLGAFVQSQRAHFEQVADAETVAPSERPAGVSAAEGAAWTAAARVLLNLDEFITRE